MVIFTCFLIFLDVIVMEIYVFLGDFMEKWMVKCCILSFHVMIFEQKKREKRIFSYILIIFITKYQL